MTRRPGTQNRRDSGVFSSEFLLVGGTVCAVLLWSTYLYMVWTPGVLDRAGAVKGWDFPQFYALGRIGVSSQRADLADGRAIGRAATATVSSTLASNTFVPVYGPQVALLFTPLARLPYLVALAGWLGLSIVLYACCCATLWRSCASLRSQGPLTAVLCAAAPALFFLVCYAQLSAIALVLFTLAYFALQRDQPVAAGLALGSLIYKPQLGIAAGLIFLAAGEWRIVAGAIAAATTQVGVAWAYAGGAVLRSYVHTLQHLNDNIVLVQEKQHLLQSLSTFVDLLVPWPRVSQALYLMLAAGALVAAWRVWADGWPLELRYSMVLLATVLVSPHFYVYDLLIVVPVGFLVTDWLLRLPVDRHRTAITTCLVLLYISPLVGPAIAKAIRFQPTVPIMCALATLIVRQSTHATRREHQTHFGDAR